MVDYKIVISASVDELNYQIMNSTLIDDEPLLVLEQLLMRNDL